ncbi:Bacteriophage T5, Orf172 DNA-binding [uncultured Caudovirales phage]|uniref:Bacteriophage T5, Orf172 DNA-binding n=1 Tax=uncultured Caudovirales phage TaxID=2100421 RepID=A0A6J5LTC4_9CAUD|nr:Bacteriophage T5, Orf172 DNA-binding [uncultured Caudovirales phage]
MSVVYFIGPVERRYGIVKIGMTRAGVLNRLSALQTGSPMPLCIYAFVEDEGRLERALHETFASLREHGEWFRLEYKLLELVEHLAGVTYGDRPASRSELWDGLFNIVCTDEVPLRWEDEEDAYLFSADAGHMSMYTHDIAWAEYQRDARK